MLCFFGFWLYTITVSLKMVINTEQCRSIFLILLLGLALCVPSHAQTAEQSVKSYGFFVSPLVEISGYGREGMGLGGGLALGMGDDVSIGLRLLFAKAMGVESLSTLEIVVFMRFFPFSSNIPTGFFFQLEAGGAIFAYKKAVSFPSDAGDLTAGIAAGWCFPLGKRWYIEPNVRVGYPYIAGTGVSASFRF